MKARLAINRGGGVRDVFDIDYEKYTTILDALESIRSSREEKVLYRHSCHHGSCGTCGAIANGMRILMCTTRIADVGDEIDLDPLSPFTVIGDLAIDPSTLHNDFPRERDYLMHVDSAGAPPTEIERFVRFENCIDCGLCESSCPIGSNFLGPAALSAFHREIEKHPAREAEMLRRVGGDDGARRCDRALECSRACPLGVYPARHIAELNRRLGEQKRS